MISKPPSQWRSFEEIIRLIQDMMRLQTPTLLRMKEVLDHYDGDYILPIPSVVDEPSLPPLTPALVGEAVDQMALRCASVTPTVFCPPLSSKIKGVRSLEYANLRRTAINHVYYKSKWKLGVRRAYRQLAAYYTTSVVVFPDTKLGLPAIEVRDPLGTYAEPLAAEQLRPPSYVAFITRYSGQFLRGAYPDVRSENGGPITPHHIYELWDVAEWYDEDQIMWGLVGPVRDQGLHLNVQFVAAPWMPLTAPIPNKCGMVPVMVPHNVSLGRIISRIGSMLGNVDLQAKLIALDILAQEKAIFPDTYIVGTQSGQPRIISNGGEWVDGREGKINILSDVQSVGLLRNTPDQRTSQVVDRLERNFKTSTALVPQQGGETYGALRTGKGITDLAGMALDPRMQELHEVMEAYAPHMNEAILACYKGYFGPRTFSLYSGQATDNQIRDFIPNVHVETLDNTVSFGVAGADAVQTTQILGSLVGTGALSRRSFRERHPWITNPEMEGEQVNAEQFEQAMKEAVLQQITSGQMPLRLASMIQKHLANRESIFDAIEKADDEVKKMQAQQAQYQPGEQPPPGTPPEAMAGPGGGPPPQVGPAAAQPGIAAGPTALQQPFTGQPQEIDVPRDAQRMRRLLHAMSGR